MNAAVIVPVKDLGQAKSRLAPLLSLAERRALAELMLAGVLRVVAAAGANVRKIVVTNYEPAIALAAHYGMECLRETRQISESHSVDWASAVLAEQGMEAVLRLPLDLPLIEGGDVGAILEEGLTVQSVLVPSIDGTGTNAIFRRPPCLFPSRFGPGSLALHEQSLRSLRVPYSVRPLTSLALDLDDSGDVENLLMRETPCPAAAYLRELGVPDRLKGMQRAGA